MNKHRIFISVILAEIVVLLVLFLGGISRMKSAEGLLQRKTELVKSLMLTDLSVWTEARYTRHPSQADWFAPFQDYPSSIEHFPAGSLLHPPGRMYEEGVR
jgi:hypothetical protein